MTQWPNDAMPPSRDLTRSMASIIVARQCHDDRHPRRGSPASRPTASAVLENDLVWGTFTSRALGRTHALKVVRAAMADYDECYTLE
jgi:hypothetical protein